MRVAERGAKKVAVLGIAAYAVAVWLFTTIAPTTSKAAAFLVDWMALPVQLFATIASAYAARKWQQAPVTARACWALLGAASALSTVSLIYWNLWEPHQAVPWLATGDVLYVLDYALMAAALAALLALFGGSLRSSLIWLDGLSILAAVLATVWAMVLGPLAPANATIVLPWGYVSAYCIAAASLLMLGSLLWTRIPVGVAGQWIIALIGAAYVQAAWIIGWIGSWLTESDFLTYLADYGEVVCYSLVGVAAITVPERPSKGGTPDIGRKAFAFLPTLSILVSIALISGLLATRPGAGAWVVTGLIVLCLLLLLARHTVAKAEFECLRDELSRREGDERISELVRQSSDGFLVVRPNGLIAFASPAIESIVGKTADRLVGSDPSTAFGPANEAAVAHFLRGVRARSATGQSLELIIPTPTTTPRVIRILAANHLENPRIRGVTLVATDISKERALEREVIDIASAERLRLAADVHDGVGQELTGIALMLQRIANRGKDGPPEQHQELTELIGYVNHTISDVRELAHGLSPLYVAHGSLARALRALAARAESPPVEVDVDPELNDRHVDGAAGDHLYQIAAEAVHNARRHAACTRIALSLAREPGRVVLSIRDDGSGFRADDSDLARRGVGLRLMEYRARAIGAVLHIDSRPNIGTRVTATLPIREIQHGVN